MQIDIDNLKIETIDYIDGRGFKHPKKGIRDLKKVVSVKFNTNSILVDVLKHQLKYYPYIKANWYKGKNTDSLFLELIGVNHQLIRLFNKYNKILSELTYKEEALLDNIKNNSYISKKYSYYDDILDNEYGYYEPISTIDNYDDYDNIKNQSVFHNKRINYEKPTYKKQDVVTKTFEQATKTFTDFKASNLKLNYNSSNLMLDIFNIRLQQCSFKLHNNYHRVKNVYDDYDDFIKHMVIYGANHHSNQRFWQIIKRELY